MKNIIKTIAIVTALSASSAQAYWDGPFNGFGNGFGDMFGDMSFSFKMSANSNVRGYGYGNYYNQPYYGYPYYAAPVAPVTPVAPKAETK